MDGPKRRFPTGRYPRHPVFRIVRFDQGRSLKWLARQTGYSHQHVKNVAGGRFRASDAFRRRCAEVLAMTEAELFCADQAEPIAAAS